MSCASIDPRGAEPSEASPVRAETCRALRNAEEEDRLSTAAPSLCGDTEDATTRWADVADDECNFLAAVKGTNSRRWADLYDSDDEDDQAQSSSRPSNDAQPAQPEVKEAAAAAAKPRWADLAEDPEEQETAASSSNAVTQSSKSSEDEGSWKCQTYQTSKWWNWKNASYEEEATSSTGAHNGSRKWRQAESHYQVKPARHSEGQWRRGSWATAGGSWHSHEKPSPTPKGKGKGKAGGKATGKGGGTSKCQCQYTIGIEEEARFRVCRRLLGQKGQHMKDIAEQTGAKLRLRGRGSKFLEGPEQKESADPLMLCVSVPDPASYEEAKRLVSSLLEDIYAQFREFQLSEGLKPRKLYVNMHEGPRPGSF